MKFDLKQIRADKCDELRLQCINSFDAEKGITIPLEKIEECSETLFNRSEKIEIDLDLEKYNEIIASNEFKYVKKAKLGFELYKDFATVVGDVPFDYIYSENTWAYLSLTVFRDLIFKISDLEKPEDIVNRYYFSMGTMDRTAFRFYWYFAYVLEGDLNRLLKAHEYIDPVKAVFERNMSKNYKTLIAFVDAIDPNYKDINKLKQNGYRTAVPLNYNSHAAVTFLDDMDLNELTMVAAKIQKNVINALK